MGMRRGAQCGQVCTSVHWCAQVCVKVCGCLQVCAWDEFSEYLLENRVPTSADFNTYPIRILELKLCFDRLALHIDSGHTFVPEAKLLNKMSTKNLKIKCPKEFALMNTIE